MPHKIPCKDCRADDTTTTIRPAPHQGPRCATHHRTAQRARRRTKADRRRENTYGITSSEYEAILASQDGRCAICQRATGKTKALAVDHQHGKPGCRHPRDEACRECVRAICCGPCNQMIGRHNIDSLKRAIHVLRYQPAQQILIGLDQ